MGCGCEGQGAGECRQTGAAKNRAQLLPSQPIAMAANEPRIPSIVADVDMVATCFQALFEESQLHPPKGAGTVHDNGLSYQLRAVGRGVREIRSQGSMPRAKSLGEPQCAAMIATSDDDAHTQSGQLTTNVRTEDPVAPEDQDVLQSCGSRRVR